MKLVKVKIMVLLCYAKLGYPNRTDRKPVMSICVKLETFLVCGILGAHIVINFNCNVCVTIRYIFSNGEFSYDTFFFFFFFDEIGELEVFYIWGLIYQIEFKWMCSSLATLYPDDVRSVHLYAVSLC
jgi:hypothetical protein